MPEKNRIDNETKAAVMAALLTGQSVASVARQYKLNPSTIRNWKSLANLEGAVNQEVKYQIGDKLVAYVEKSLDALANQTALFGEASWLASQSAADLAVLHGIVIDKTIRLIEALASGGNQEDGE